MLQFVLPAFSTDLDLALSCFTYNGTEMEIPTC